MSEKICATAQRMSRSGFFWNDKGSKFSLIVEQRFRNRSFRPIISQKKYSKVE